VSTIDARLGRIARERERAVADGDYRRVARLDVRRARLTRDAATARAGLARAARPDVDLASERERAHFLDRQAALPAAGERRRAELARHSERRDYAALAGLAGRAPSEYERLAPREQRVARAAIDRELALRRERLVVGGWGERAAATRRPWAREQREASGARDAGGSVHAEADLSSRIIDDARAFAEGRKRQLGIGRP
jgi:hypothetical protein